MKQFNRLKLQIKEENYQKIKNTTIAIIGLGGVGGYTLESLVRCGIGKIIIIDNDIIDITNLNRQLISLNSNVGQKKIEAWKERIKDINPNAQVICIDKFITKENIDEIFKYMLDEIYEKEVNRQGKKNHEYNNQLMVIKGYANNPKKLEEEISELMKDEYDEITSKKGIYEYVLSGDERSLSIRAFRDSEKRTVYERQKGICPKCKKHFEISEMEADHITPYSKGGHTIVENCQMLCRDCNRRKSNI